jgi:hypothetical protein
MTEKIEDLEYFKAEPKRTKTHEVGPYTLVVGNYDTKEGCWDYTKGTVFKGEEELVSVCRNYGMFPFSFVLDHPTGHDYLICGSDYQGQTIVDLNTGERVDHLPSTARDGLGFCWSAHYPSPSGQYLAVEGCHWGAPYEVRIFDFSEPMKAPWPLLYIPPTTGEADFGSWDGDTVHMEGEVEYYPSYGKCWFELSEAETEEVDNLEEEGTLVDVQYEVRTFSYECGKDYEKSLRALLGMLVPDQEGAFVVPEYKTQARHLYYCCKPPARARVREAFPKSWANVELPLD